MVAKQIKELRETCGLSQADVAHRLGISRTSVSAWEMGSACPSAAYLIELSKLFSVTVDYLLGIESGLNVKLDGLTDEERKIIFGLLSLFAANKQ